MFPKEEWSTLFDLQALSQLKYKASRTAEGCCLQSPVEWKIPKQGYLRWGEPQSPLSARISAPAPAHMGTRTGRAPFCKAQLYGEHMSTLMSLTEGIMSIFITI